MKVSIRSITITTLKLLLKDKIIFAPYLIFLLSLGLIDHYFHFSTQKNVTYLLVIITVSWFLELIFKAITLNMANMLRQKTHINIKDSVFYSIKRFPHLAFSNVLLFIPVGSIMYLIMQFSNLEKIPLAYAFIGLILVIIILFISLILEFIPILVVCERENGWQGIKKSVRFVKKYFMQVIKFTVLCLFIIINTFFLTAILEQVPILGTAFLKSIAQGIGYTFVYVLGVVFYFQFKEDVGVSISC